MIKKIRWKRFLLSLFYLVLAALFASPVIVEFVNNYEFKKWSKSPGTVVEFSYDEYKCKSLCGKDDCKEKTDMALCYRPKIKYEYLVDNKIVTGNSLYQDGVHKDHSKKEVDEIRRKITSESGVVVSYKKN